LHCHLQVTKFTEQPIKIDPYFAPLELFLQSTKIADFPIIITFKVFKELKTCLLSNISLFRYTLNLMMLSPMPHGLIYGNAITLLQVVSDLYFNKSFSFILHILELSFQAFILA